MGKINFDINDKTYRVLIDDAPPFSYRKEGLVSNAQTDITFSQDWYNVGFSANGFLDNDEFRYLKEELTKCVQNIISAELGADIEGFELNNYHHFVTTNELHFKVVSKTRDLFPSDFNFPLAEIIPKFEKILGFKLTDISPFDGSQLHIILRINRPNSTDYNPPHKDIRTYPDIGLCA